MPVVFREIYLINISRFTEMLQYLSCACVSALFEVIDVSQYPNLDHKEYQYQYVVDPAGTFLVVKDQAYQEHHAEAHIGKYAAIYHGASSDCKKLPPLARWPDYTDW